MKISKKFRYWIREGNYEHPRSCLEIRDRGFRDNIKYSNGVFEIEPVKGTIVETYCDFSRHGGGWTLVVKSTSQSEWSKENARERNSEDASKAEFSIFSYIDEMKQLDVAEVNKYLLCFSSQVRFKKKVATLYKSTDFI